jgi:hypothetical protein
MMVVDGPGELLELAHRLEDDGANGFLLSGGCLPDGRIPLHPFLDTLREIKESTSLKVNLHTDLLDAKMSRRLVETGADCFSVDLVHDMEVIEGTMHLTRGPMDFEATISHLLEKGARRVVPHICVGLPGSSIKGERASIDFLVGRGIHALVVLGFLPTPGTPFSGSPSPSMEWIIDFIHHAVDRLDRPVLLGCMRSRRDRQLEIEAIRSGVEAVANPSHQTIGWARDHGLEVELEESCCALYL